MTTVKKYRSFGFTVSTVEPITKDSETHAYIEEWVKGHEFGMAIIEKSKRGKLHAHGQVFLKTATTKDSIQKHFRKNILRMNPLSNKHAVDFSLAYNDDFINNYLEKDDFQWEIYRNLPCPEDTRQYYPTEEEQAKVMAKHNAKDAYYHMLKEMWGDKELLASTHIECHTEIAFWLYEQMFVERTIPTIPDDRKRKQTVKTLIHYLYPYKFDVKGYMLTAAEEDQLKNIQLIKMA